MAAPSDPSAGVATMPAMERRRLLIVTGSNDLSEIAETPWVMELVQDSDTVVAVSPLGRASVLRSRHSEEIEVGVVRLR